MSTAVTDKPSWPPLSQKALVKNEVQNVSLLGPARGVPLYRAAASWTRTSAHGLWSAAKELHAAMYPCLVLHLASAQL